MTPQQKQLMKHLGLHYVIDAHLDCERPTVSVIIPTRDCLEYLHEAIKSIQKQGVEDVEIIIMNDGSTDKTAWFLSMASSCDQRIKVFHTHGIGVAAARNAAIRAARGKYLSFLDADDYWLPGKLLKQIAFHEKHPDVGLSFCNYLHFNDKQHLGDCFGFWPQFKRMCQGAEAGKYQRINNKGLACLYGENVVGTSTVMMNTKALARLPQFDEKLVSAEDWDLWLMAASQAPIGFCADVDVAYLMRPGSETSRVLPRLEALSLILKRYRNQAAKQSKWALCRGYARLFTGLGEYHRMDQQTVKAMSYHFIACVLSPSVRSGRAFLADSWSVFRKATCRLQRFTQKNVRFKHG